jgi:hypothetical protein
MNPAILRDRHCSNVRLYRFHIARTIVYGHVKNKRKPKISFLSVEEWNESEYGMSLSGVSKFMNIFWDISLVGSLSVSVTAYPLFAADDQLDWHDLLSHRTLHFDEGTMTYKFLTQHLPIFDMELRETVFVNVVLNITVDTTFRYLSPCS